MAEEELITVYKKNSDHYPWHSWTVARVPPQGDDKNQNGGEGDGNGDGEDGDESENDSDGSGGDGRTGESQYRNGANGGRPTSGNGGEIIKVGGTIICKYDSFDAFIDDADDVMRPRAGGGWERARSSRDKGNKGWSGSNTFEEALDQARNGWPHGMLKINQVAEEYTRRTRWCADRALTLDVAGAYPDVPEFLSGNPANMYDNGADRNRMKPLVHIIVNRCNNCGVESRQILNFGAAMMVCIDQIEACGARVELEAVVPVRSSSGRDKAFITQTMVKRAHEHIEKNRLAFAMAHAGMLRRIWFSIIEQHPELYTDFHSGYGQCADMQNKLIPPGAIYIPASQNFGGSAWDSVDTAVKCLQDKFGIKISQDGTIEMGKVELDK